jgi:hypothetical protein
MKKISFLILIGILLFKNSIKAQNIIIDPTTNWQQYISTILGGNCLSISNVTFTAGSEAAGRFSNAQGIGLNSGVLITTGKTSNVLDSIVNNTGFMGLPGDSDITALAQASESPWILSYDAAVLEFDFVSDVTDSVIIKYVFGSKEYPEFAPPNSGYFSDLFAFWVTDSSGARQNIATLPNGVPVSINNINAITNTEYYIEGEYDVGRNMYGVHIKEGYQYRAVIAAIERYSRTGKYTYVIGHFNAPTKKATLETKRVQFQQEFTKIRIALESCGLTIWPIVIMGYFPQDKENDNMKELVKPVVSPTLFNVFNGNHHPVCIDQNLLEPLNIDLEELEN